MSTSTKRAALLAMALLTLAMNVLVPIRKIEAATTYNNTISANLNCSMNSGELSAYLDVTGIKGTTTQISVELYVEKRVLGIFWKKVNIGYPNNVWTDSVSGYLYSNVFTTQLSSTGTYRTTVTYTVSGSGGTPDEITLRSTVAY